jgi:hypothetical protein
VEQRGWRSWWSPRLLVEGRSKSEVTRDYGIFRRWVITHVQWSLADGDAGPGATITPPP